MTRLPRGPLRDEDPVLFIDRKTRRYLKILRAGKHFLVRGGRVESDDLIGRSEGVSARNHLNESFLVVRPTYPDLVLNLPRKAQVIYPKDTGLILLWGDIFPGARVVEAGSGPGALTMALLRAVGNEGEVITYEIREDFGEMATKNISRYFGEAPNWTLRQGDIYEALPETDIDRLILDVPEPWRVLDHAAAALRPGGVFVGYLPTVLQVKQLVDSLTRHECFGLVESFENLLRFWSVRGLSIRPEHRMVAHTGFIVIARRIQASRDSPARSQESGGE